MRWPRWFGRRMVVAAAWLALLAVMFAAVVTLIAIRDRSHERQVGSLLDRIDTLEAKYGEALSNLAQEQAATTARGDEPASTPAEEIASTPAVPSAANVVTVAGEKGERGPGPTDAQVRMAVAGYLTANPPQPGRPPTDGEIAAAVAAYCSARGGCRGADGPAGQSTVGPQGPVGPRGEPGPGPSDEQVAVSVGAYCSTRAGCVGPPGPQGPAGPAMESFTFAIGITEYACADQDRDLHYTCPATTPPP